MEEPVKNQHPISQISRQNMAKQSFAQKWKATYEVLNTVKRATFLDVPFAFIPKIIYFIINYVDEEVIPEKIREEEYKDDEIPWKYYLWWIPLYYLLAIPYAIQLLIGVTITALLTPLIALVHWVYPEDKLARNKEKTVKSFLFNPSTWMMGFILLTGISLLIQYLNIGMFADTAAILAVMQASFVALAVVVAAIAILSSLFTSSSQPSKYNNADPAEVSLDDLTEEANQNKDPINTVKTTNAISIYFTELGNWISKNKVYAGVLIALGVLGILTVSTLTIGYFVFPDTFSFIAGLFNFIGNNFISGIQHVATLPGLGFLGLIPESVLLLIGQVLTVFTLFFTATVVPHTIQRIIQTRMEDVEFYKQGVKNPFEEPLPEDESSHESLQTVTPTEGAWYKFTLDSKSFSIKTLGKTFNARLDSINAPHMKGGLYNLTTEKNGLQQIHASWFLSIRPVKAEQAAVFEQALKAPEDKSSQEAVVTPTIGTWYEFLIDAEHQLSNTLGLIFSARIDKILPYKETSRGNIISYDFYTITPCKGGSCMIKSTDCSLRPVAPEQAAAFEQAFKAPGDDSRKSKPVVSQPGTIQKTEVEPIVGKWYLVTPAVSKKSLNETFTLIKDKPFFAHCGEVKRSGVTGKIALLALRITSDSDIMADYFEPEDVHLEPVTEDRARQLQGEIDAKFSCK